MFQGGSPWAALIFNSMFVVAVLYCVQFFFEAIFFQNPLLLSLAIAFVSYLVQFSWHPLLDFYGVDMGFLYIKFLWEFYDFLWCFYDISMGFLWYFYDISMGILWDVHDISIGFLIFLWYFYEIIMGFKRVSMVFLYMIFLEDFFGNSMGFPWGFFGISVVVLW